MLKAVFRHYLDNLEFQMNTCQISARFRALGIYSGQFTELKEKNTTEPQPQRPVLEYAAHSLKSGARRLTRLRTM